MTLLLANLRRTVAITMAVLLAATLAACGGSGSDGGAAGTQPPTPTATSSAPSTPAPTAPAPTSTPGTPVATPSATPGTPSASPSPGAGVTITGGKTEIEFDDQHERAIDDAGVAFKAIGPSRQDGRHEVDLKPTGGTVDPRALTGSIEHEGGIEFSTGQGAVRITGISIDLDKAEMTGVIDGQRITVLTLDLSDTEHGDHHYEVDIDDVDGSFTHEAAEKLNSALGTTVFGPSLKVEMELEYNPR